MSSSGSGEFDNSDYQKDLCKFLLKNLSQHPDTPKTPEEIYEAYFEPAPHPCSQELIAYLVERMVQHEDRIVARCEDDPDCIQLISRRVGGYIQTHLETAGDPFPSVDPEPFRDGES